MTRKTAFKPLGHEEMKSNKERGKSLSTENKLTGLLSELQDRGYREAYVEAHAKDTIAFQLRQMRLAENWEQKDVAAKLGNPKLQPMISRYENPDYGKYSVTTLRIFSTVFSPIPGISVSSAGVIWASCSTFSTPCSRSL